MREEDLYFLDLTLALAAKGEGHVKPNPLVGAIVVKNGVIVGQGFHRYDGVKHAEVLALEEAGQHAKDATIYVNLEPLLPSRKW
jgi:diaminohydroxyphosphoribosylaminopyrimidine deaminase/5-amino-6-(5-phosphoribosylamino)uracil reductase